ncbi:MAG: heimdallarchaeosortase [Candidatus Heimdallarchaeota archaeon]
MKRSLIPSEENPHPLLDLQGQERRNFVIRSIFITTFMTLVIYVLWPNYYILESIITKSSVAVLDIFGFKSRIFVYEDSLQEVSSLDRFLMRLYDPSRVTYPAISMDTPYGRSNYLIVRACTGMQAGALLLGLIWSTPATLHDRIRASYVMLLSLYIGNILWIAAQIGMVLILINNFGVVYVTAWAYAHDWTGKPIGFFGTIAFTILIEMRNVKILDTITVWIDWITGAKPKTAVTKS